MIAPRVWTTTNAGGLHSRIPMLPSPNRWLWRDTSFCSSFSRRLAAPISMATQASQHSCWNAAKSLCLFGVVARNLDLIGVFGAKSHRSFGPSLSECLLQFVQKHCLINFGKLLALFRHIEHINCLLSFGIDQGNLDVAIEARHCRS